jgi:cation diffusion facilitator CzcD-associated flavoprotein CzcO
MEYLRDITKKHDLDSKIRLGHKVTSANWDSGTQHWGLKVQVQGHEISIVTKYLMMGTGYYDADHVRGL